MQGQVLYRDIGSLASRGVSCDTAQGCALERCDTALAHVALGHDTVVGPATQRVEARGEAHKGAGARRAWHCAQGRARACCDTAGPGHDTAWPGCDTALGGGGGHDTAMCERLGAPGALAGPVGGSCRRFGFSTR